MVIDTSAVMAILADESDATQFARAIQADNVRLMSAATYVEASIVIEARYGQPGITKLDELLDIAQISIEPVTQEQALAAREAYRRFGKGRHPAGLNFGDCFAYALSLQSGEPLLFKGTDFAQTDVAQVL